MYTTFLIRVKHNFDIIKKFLYTKILRKKYYRTGHCNCCGECCQHIYVKHGNKVIKTEKQFEYLQLLHRFYTYLEVIGSDEIGLIFSCKMLKDNKCSIHKSRPGICRRYPQEEIFMMGGGLAEKCGYKLEPIIPFSEVFENVLKNNDKK
jgi:Fe-S-cluster containining protein